MSDFSPKNLLLPYQRASADDSARFVFDLWSRQTGKDFTATEVIVENCLQVPKTTWLIAAPSERQSLETLAKAREWTEAFQFAIADAIEEREGGSESLLKSSTIVYPNGSRVIAVPGKPETVRGFSANILLTEFAFFEKVNETWRALLPSITNPLRGGLKKVRVITTPNGKGDMVWDIWDKNFLNPDAARKQKWSCRKVNIYDAKAAGLDVDIEELREAMNDPEGFAQEFECEFIDGSNVLLPYDLIALAESADATEHCDPAFFQSGRNPVFCGIDYGRSNDPTVCVSIEEVGDIMWVREVLILRNMSTPEQNEILASRIRRATRTALDYTGPGIGFGDYAVKEFGEWHPEQHKFGKVECVTFTTLTKREMFPLLRRTFEAPTNIRVPISREFREDLHAMQQVVTNGEYNYWAPRTKEGHSDRCTALALARRARGIGHGGAITAHTAPMIRTGEAIKSFVRNFIPRRLA
jgi:phage FluMu gp28-like protein